MKEDIFKFSTISTDENTFCTENNRYFYQPSNEELNDNVMYHVVDNGDSLWSISRLYGITVEELKRINNLTGDTILVGQILYLQEQGENEHFTVHTVMVGETLWTIASRYGTSVDALRTLNNLTGDTISIGQRLIVPRRQTIIYLARPGDTLFSIARAFNTTVARLKLLNNLESDQIQIGQVFVVY